MTNLATNLVATAARVPDKVGIKLDQVELSWSALHRAAAAVAGQLRAAGLEPGDRVSLILPNVPAYPVAFYGTLLAGGVVVPMNPLLKSGEIQYFYEDSGARFSFVWPDFAEEAGKAAAETGTRLVVCGPMGPADGQFDASESAAEPGARAGRARRRRHRGDPLHERHDRQAQGRRADALQPPPQRRAFGGRHHGDHRGRRHHGLPAPLPRLRPDLRPQHLGAARLAP